MATIYAIEDKGQYGEVFVDFVQDGKRIERMLYVRTQTEGQYLACTESGETFGYRHTTVKSAIAEVARVNGWTAVRPVSAAHPSVRGMLQHA